MSGGNTDTLQGFAHAIGTDFNDILTGDAGANRLEGGTGADLLAGGAGDDTLLGGSGEDRITDTTGVVTIDAGADNDRILLQGAATTGSIDGGAGIDALQAGPNGGSLSALGGFTITGVEVLETSTRIVRATALQLEAFDLIHFSDINDASAVRLEIAASGAATVLDLADEVNDGSVGRAVQVFGSSDAEVLTTGAGHDTVTGADGADMVTGGGGDDDLSGGSDNDTLIGQTGKDMLTGGMGDDSLAGGEGDDCIDDAVGAVTAIAAGNGNDLIRLGGHVFTSGTVGGGNGMDTLATGGSTDLGGLSLAQLEVLETGGGSVTGRAAQFAGFQTICSDVLDPTAPVMLTLTASGGTKTLDLTAALLVEGGSRGVALTGSTDNEVLTTGAGDDTLSGGAGNDVLRGGAGNDSVVDTLGSTVSMDGGLGHDRLLLGALPFASGMVEGGEGQDTLEATGDLSKLTVQNIEILQSPGAIRAFAAQLAGFDIIRVSSGLPNAQVTLSLVSTRGPMCWTCRAL